ncbi:MAG: transketolase [Geminicoccaceae bacterium]|nr:transketolase [Geminicoccaceae bacterium]MDW8125328.1 transketolase [Geminicoccaceae bacterium]
MLRNHPPPSADLERLRAVAHAIRRTCIDLATGKGQGYLGQALGFADVMAAVYFHELRWDPRDLDWPERDRFVLSTGHYAIVLWATLAEAGAIPREELATFATDDSRLDMSTLDTSPGVEATGGSLGHGLPVAVGMALGLRLSGSDARVFCELSDGECQEGSTWEAALSAATFGLDRLVAIVDANGIQADGEIVVALEPLAEKWRAFGFDTQEIDGNDMAAVVAALERARARDGRPKAIVCRTLPGKGVPRLERREKAHFIRVEADEWEAILAELEAERARASGRAAQEGREGAT